MSRRNGKRRMRANRRAAVQTKGRSCTGKRSFLNLRQARRDLDRLVAAGEVRDSLNTYACRHCGLLHNGHVPGYRRRNR